MDLCLERDEWRLEEGASAYAGQDLEDYYARPRVAIRGKANKKAGPKCQEDGAKPDSGKVLACSLDEDADNGRAEGERENVWEEVNPWKDGSGTEDGLEVKWEEKSCGDEYHAVAEADNQRTNIGLMLKNPERHDRVSGKFPLVEEKETQRG